MSIDMPGAPKAEEAMTYLHYTVGVGMVWLFRGTRQHKVPGLPM